MEQFTKKMKNYRWLIWAVLCMAYFISFFHRGVVGVVKDDLVGTFGMSATNFANLSSTYFYVYLVMQLPTGILADTLGPRVTTTVGMLLAAIGSIIFGVSPNIFLIFLGRVFIGLGVSVIYISILKTLSVWFHEKEFGKMTGLTLFFGNSGAIVAQTPLILMISVLTWRYTFVMIGILSLVIAILCFVVVRNKPSDVGLPQISDNKNAESQKISVFKALSLALKNPYTWPPLFMYMGFFGAYQAFAGTWGQSYLTSIYGMSKAEASNYLIVVIAGMCLGGLLIGPISDKLSKRKFPMLMVGTIYTLSWAYIVFISHGKPPIEFLGILLFLLGLSYSSVSLTFACGKEANNSRYAGTATSLVNMGGFIGAAIVPVLMGRIIDIYGKVLTPQQLYAKAFFVCFISVAVGYISLLLIKETGCKNIYESKGTVLR